ncbi:MAG: hypothetical protein Q9204_001829 [Flavoplaca sp. TL-2023a]
MSTQLVLKGVVQDARPNESIFRPVTVISTATGNLSEKDITDEITAFPAKDDVYSEDFASTVVIQLPTGTALENPINLSSIEQHSLTKSNVHYSTVIPTEILLPSGPYFVHDTGIYEVWRLYSDELDAFEIAVIPEAVHSPAKFPPLNMLDQQGLWKSIAVPSRLYAKESQQHPLAGARISVKDNFKLAGIKTTMTNRAFTQL